MKSTGLILLGSMLFLLGCGGEEQAQRDAMKAKLAAQRAQNAEQNQQNQGNDLERKEAEVGVGKSSRNLSGDEVDKVVAHKVLAMHAMKERIAFDVINYSVRQYEALKDGPIESHEEFMREIGDKVRPGLPKLNPGERYEWDPKEKKLYVWLKKKQ